MIILSAQQRNLSFLSLGPLFRNALNIPDRLRPWPSTIEMMVIPWRINVVVDVGFYQQLIERSVKTLKALTIRTENFAGPGEKTSFFVRNASEFLARGLFKHCMPVGSQPLLELNDLNFQNQNLHSAGSTWLQFIDFTRLRTLQVWNCDNSDDLLANLQALTRSEPLRLHGLVLSFEPSDQAPRLAQEFIGSITGLRYLNLCYSPEKPEQTAFNVQCLYGSRYTIKDLYLGIGNNNMTTPHLHVPSRDDLTWLCINCLNLAQLAIALPEISFDDAFAGRWGDYGFALVTKHSSPHPPSA